MRTPTSAAGRAEAGSSSQVTVLVAARPSLLRVIGHLFREDRELRLFRHAGPARMLARRAARLSPDLVVASVRLLGAERIEVLADLRRASPAAKLVLIQPFEALRTRGADAQLTEEALVRRLPATLWRLSGGGGRAGRPHRHLAGRT